MISASPSVCRFSPAPTGYLHLGGARSALFNWLFARGTGGRFLLRIEDTDPQRSRDDLIEVIVRTLRWLGVEWDGEPVRQSQRAQHYRDATESLLASGAAYRCDCTPDEVKARTASRPAPGYDGFCRDRAVAPGPGVAVRFRAPDDGETAFTDIIRGEVVFENATLEDFVIQRADGTATFFLPNALDDIDMGITHVIRGEDLVNATPRVLLIRDALGRRDRPVFAHLPLIVNEKRQKLSKRRDDVSVEEYRDRGYLAEAMRNYLALLGWGPPDGVEIRPIEEIVELFRLDDVTKSAAFFDRQKLDHFNGAYIRALGAGEFVQHALPWLEADPPWPPERFDLALFEKLAPLVQERVTTLAEVPAWVDFLFLEEPAVDEASWRKAMTGAAATVLDDAIAEYETCAWEPAVLHDVTAAIGERHDLKLAKAQAPIRVAVTGRSVGPPLFESLAALGRECTLERLRAARRRVE